MQPDLSEFRPDELQDILGTPPTPQMDYSGTGLLANEEPPQEKPPVQDVAPDYARILPTEAIVGDQRASAADDFKNEWMGKLADVWAEPHIQRITNTAQTLLGQAAESFGNAASGLGSAVSTWAGGNEPLAPGENTPQVTAFMKAVNPTGVPYETLTNPQDVTGKFEQMGVLAAEPVRALRFLIDQIPEGEPVPRVPFPGSEQGLSPEDIGEGIAQAFAFPLGKVEGAAAQVGTLARRNPEIMLPALNELIGAFAKAIPEGSTAWDVTRIGAGLNNAGTVLAHDIGASIKAFDLNPDELKGVLRSLEPGATEGLTEKAQLLSDTLRQTFDGTWALVRRGDSTERGLEDYFTHLVRKPIAEIREAGGGSFTPGVLSDWSRFMTARLRDDAGNIRFPTVGDLQEYLDVAHPTWKVETDIPSVVEAHVKSMLTAANNHQMIDALQNLKVLNPETGALTDALTFAKSAVNTVKVDLPNSMAKWLYRGQAPEEGAVLIARRGVIGEANDPLLRARLSGLSEAMGKWKDPADVPESLRQAFREVGTKMGIGSDELETALASGKMPKMPGEAVIQETVPVWADKATADALTRYLEPNMGIATGADNPWVQGGVDGYLKLKSSMVRTELLNLMVHGDNAISTALAEYVDPRKLVGIASDFKYARDFLTDPQFRVREMMGGAGQLDLATARDFMNDLAGRVGPIPEEAKGLSAVLAPAMRPLSWLLNSEQRVLFEGLVQNIQLMTYAANVRMGRDPEAAAAASNAMLGQFTARDRNQLANMTMKYLPLAGGWQTGQIVRLTSTLAHDPQLLMGVGANLTPAMRSQMADIVRANTARQIGLAVGSTAVLNKAFSGVWPWENEPGRWDDIATPWTNELGQRIYMPNLFFKPIFDFIKIGAGAATALQGVLNPNLRPEEKISSHFTSSGMDVITNKMSPVLSGALALSQGAQFPGGPPILTTEDLPGRAAQIMAFLANKFSPGGFQVTRNPPRAADEFRPAPGTENLSITGPGGYGWTEDRGWHGPVDPNMQKIGALTELLGGRDVYGPSFRGAGNEKEQAKAEAAFEAAKFSPATNNLFRHAGISPSVTTTGAPLPIGEGPRGKVLLTDRELKDYQEKARARLDDMTTTLLQKVGSKWENIPTEQQAATLRELVQAAKRQALVEIFKAWSPQTRKDRMNAAYEYHQSEQEQRVRMATR